MRTTTPACAARVVACPAFTAASPWLSPRRTGGAPVAVARPPGGRSRASGPKKSTASQSSSSANSDRAGLGFAGTRTQ